MRKIFLLPVAAFLISCGRNNTESGNKIVTVSITPFKYFVEEIAGKDFVVNVMVPAGADPHIYEPFPEQINMLRKSLGYISNGYLGFEMNWLGRFYETNKTMKKMSLGEVIDPISSGHHNEGGHLEGADPHYWVSPKCAELIAIAVRKFLCELNPGKKMYYEENFQNLVLKIRETDNKAVRLFSGLKNRNFMIYHPNLAYIARDYDLKEIPVEYEGKEPTPSRLKYLIDVARKENLKVIFVQREYDTKNAKAIADEIGASIVLIDPLSENWQKSTENIIDALYNCLKEGSE